MQPNINLTDFNSSTTVNPNTTPTSYLEQILNQTIDQASNQTAEYRYGFFMVDNELIDEHGAQIGPYAFFVYSAICRYSDRNGTAFPSVPTLARVTGMCEASVRKALNTLEQHSLIYRRACFGPHGRQRSNIYTLLPVEKVPKGGLVEGKNQIEPPLNDLKSTQHQIDPPPLNDLRAAQHEIGGGATPDRPKQDQSNKYTLEQETEKNNTNVALSKATVDSSLGDPVVVVVDSSSTPKELPDLALPEEQECFNHVLNRFAELTETKQPNSRDTILLQRLSGYAKNIIDNAFDAALERATNPNKPVIRDAAAWLLGTAKRMQEQGGSSVKPRSEEATAEEYRRFNRENGGVLLGLSGSVEEGGSVEEVKIKVEATVEEKAAVEEPVEAERAQPTEAQKESWAQAQRRVEGSINSVTYEMSIEPLVLVAVEGNRYTLQAPNQGIIAFLEQNGIGFVKRAFRTSLADPTAIIDFEAAEQPKRAGPMGRRFH